MADTTVISNADWVVGYDGRGHRLIRNGTVAYQGQRITYVGTNYQGPVDKLIDGEGSVVIPGLINTHSHLALEARTKGFQDDVTSRKLWMSGLYEYLPVFWRSESLQGIADGIRFVTVELIKGGTTSVLDMVAGDWLKDDVLEALEESGLRVFTGRMIRSANWYTKNGHEVLYNWDLEVGRQMFKDAVDFAENRSGDWGGRLTGILTPHGTDTIEHDLFPEIMEAARQLKVPVQLHAAQTKVEYLEMMRRHGKTPVEYLEDRGMVGPQVTFGHGVFCNHHSMIQYTDHDDVDRMAATKTNVSHCPWNFARRGMSLESFGGYVRKGINVSIGTDASPHNMMEEMRWGAMISKVVDRDAGSPTAAEAFTAATIGGANALGREDLGRLAPGTMADILILDGQCMDMRPMRDPIKNIVYYGGHRSVKTSIVDGKILMADGEVLGVDELALAKKVQEAADHTLSTVQERDWAGRTHEEMSPLSYSIWEPEQTN